MKLEEAGGMLRSHARQSQLHVQLLCDLIRTKTVFLRNNYYSSVCRHTHDTQQPSITEKQGNLSLARTLLQSATTIITIGNFLAIHDFANRNLPL